MIIVSISGPCGAGKTTLCEMLKTEFDFVRASYKNCGDATFNPTLYESKINYVEKWFEEILSHHKNGKSFILSDRSPLDSLAYLGEKQEEFKTSLNTKFSLITGEGLFHSSILITASKSILKKRIQKRTYNEVLGAAPRKYEIMLLKKSLEFFKENANLYSLTIDTSKETPIESYQKIIDHLTYILKR